MCKKLTFGLVFLLFTIVLKSQISLNAGSLRMEIDNEGKIVKLTDKLSNTNYKPEIAKSYLFRIKVEGEEKNPVKAGFNDNILQLEFPGKINAGIKVEEKGNYLVFELVSINNKEKIDVVLWGPVSTSISDTIGEIIGVVRNAVYALGIQGLNAKTTGGVLENDQGVVWARGTAAIVQEYGSSLQAFTTNSAKDRDIIVWREGGDTGHKTHVKAIKEGNLEGSAIALFGVKPKDVLNTIGDIEIKEGLPHPEIDGVWIKKSKETGRAYLISSFTESNIDTLLDYAKKMGMLSLYHEHPFQTWGHFELIKNQFPNGREGMKKCVIKGKALGIRVGVHTLTTFLTTNDPFISPVPSDNLALSGFSLLAEDISSENNEIIVADPEPFRRKTHLQSVKIGKEIIRYNTVTEEIPYTLTECVRGAFGTEVTIHNKGEMVGKLLDHAYKVFYPDWELQKEVVQNMADFFNETGVSQMDFDGHEGTYSTGMGDYSMSYFAEEFQKKVNHTVVNGSSRSNHYYWHVNHYLNWGEPWYGGFRESMSDYRFKNQPLLERNYMPNMLGWFLLTENTTVGDIDWMLARAAGYNAGYALVARMNALKNNPQVEQVVRQVRLWEDAKRSGVFPAETRERLKDPENEFHLDEDGDMWILQSFEKYQFEYIQKILQPGQPTFDEWSFTLSEDNKDFSIKILASGEEGDVKNPEFEIDNYLSIKIPVTITAGQSLAIDDSEEIRIYDNKGRQIEIIKSANPLPLLNKGNHTIKFNCEFNQSEDIIIKSTIRVEGEVEKFKKKL